MVVILFRCLEVKNAISSGNYPVLSTLFKDIPVKNGWFVESRDRTSLVKGDVITAFENYTKTSEYNRFYSEFGCVTFEYDVKRLITLA